MKKVSAKLFTRYLPLILAGLGVVVVGLVLSVARKDTPSAEAGWYSTGGTWTNRKQITIDYTKVSTTTVSSLSNFSVLFSVTDSDLRHTSYGGKVGTSNGQDILFTASDGTTKLNHELEKHASSTGETVAWVQIPTLSGTENTIIYIYFGNAGASDQQQATSTWDSFYKGVWHLSEGDSTAANFYKDSTSNANHGTMTDADGDTVSEAAQIASGLHTSGDSDDRVQVSSSSTLANLPNNGGLTLTGWARVDSGGLSYLAAGRIIDKLTEASNGWGLHTNTNTDVRRLMFKDDWGGTDYQWITGNGAYSYDTLFYVALTYDGSSAGNDPVLYVNGQLVAWGTDANTTGTRNDDSGTGVGFLNKSGGLRQAKGVMDEFRIANTVRIADWIKTEYNNQYSSSTFYQYGLLQSPERTTAGVIVKPQAAGGVSWYSSSWGYRKEITIDKNKLSATATTTFSNFPMLFSVTDSDLKYTSYGGKVGTTNGQDILFTASDGATKLNHELEKYASSTGETVAWVQIPTLSAASDTVLYVYYGNSGASDQQQATSTWDSFYKGVWHHGAGSGGNANDSTSNGNNGSLTNTTWSSGQIGNALSFDGSSSKNDLGSRSSLNMTTTVTVSGWFVTDVSSVAVDANRIYIHSELAGSPWDEYGLGQYDTKVRWELETSDSLTYFDSTTTLATGTWYYAVGTWDNTNMRVYINGNEENSALKSGTITNHNDQSDIGFGTAAGNYFDGILDEIRVSSIARSADWIKTEYNNQSSPATFYSYGAAQSETRKDSSGNPAPAVKVRGGVKFR